MISKITPLVETVSHSILRPIPRPDRPVIKVLSITDAATSAIPGPECVWFLDAPETPHLLSPNLLKESLESTLAAYPFFAGQLEQIPFKVNGDWTQRHGRLRVIYGTDDDPGIQVAIAECNHKLSDVVPDQTQRGRLWDSDEVPLHLFQGTELPMALHDGVELGPDLSLMRVKITTFSCGGVAIAAKVVHPLCDAEALTCFIRYWSTVHAHLDVSNTRNGGRDSSLSQLAPSFDPDLFMSYASGNLDATTADDSLVLSARSLPMHRYDWWASAKGCPPGLLWRTQITEDVKASGIILPSLSTPIPWDDLDFTSGISSYSIQFSAREISNMYAEATSQLYSNVEVAQPGKRISRLDVLLAHLWTLVIRARALPPDDEIYFNMVVNFRGKIDPPLSKYSVGTPAVLGYARSTAKDTIGREGLSALAGEIRSTVQSFNTTTISHFLHDAAHQIEPKRYWQVFIGKHHVSATAWLHHGLYDIDFGSGKKPRYVEPVMPPYMICVTEGLQDKISYKEEKRPSKTQSWYANGASVAIHLESDVLNRLLQDPELRRFDY